jgi:hypothetical protein
MNDPKYQFGDTDRLYHRTGEYFIDENEPVMVLRGKDVTALHACMMYVQVLLDMEPNEVVDSHLDSSIERLKTFYLYQTSSGVSGVGCSQKHHSGSEKILDKARVMLLALRVIRDDQ